MGTETIARLAGRALGVLLAPAHWLERARGRRRVALVVLYLAIAAVLWWAMSLNGLPDIGDPFDVRAASRVDVPDEANAFVLYKQAAAKLHALSHDESKRYPMPPSWRLAPPEIRRWVEGNREAMDLFRLGSERPAALYYQPGDLTYTSPIPLVTDLREFARLGTLEAARLAEAGDLAGAWGWYRAVLRSSRHVSAHGTFIQGIGGRAMLSLMSGPAMAWAADLRSGPPLLRRALRDVVACEPLMPRVSEMLKLEYLPLLKEIEVIGPVLDPSFFGPENWIYQAPGVIPADLLLRREPERSRRVIRLVFANWLESCDLPPGRRPAFLRGRGIELFDTAPNPLTPVALSDWLRSTRIAIYFLPATASVITAMDLDRSTFAALEVTLAEQLYLREHGRPPATLGDLIGPDLPRLPVGRDPGEPSILAPIP